MWIKVETLLKLLSSLELWIKKACKINDEKRWCDHRFLGHCNESRGFTPRALLPDLILLLSLLFANWATLCNWVEISSHVYLFNILSLLMLFCVNRDWTRIQWIFGLVKVSMMCEYMWNQRKTDIRVSHQMIWHTWTRGSLLGPWRNFQNTMPRSKREEWISDDRSQISHMDQGRRPIKVDRFVISMNLFCQRRRARIVNSRNLFPQRRVHLQAF